MTSYLDEPTWRTCDGCGCDLYGCLNDDFSEAEYCAECAAEMMADDESDEAGGGEE